MNQIAERTERTVKPALTSGGSISAIVPQSIEEAYRIANAVVSAGMAPRSLDTPEKAMVAIMHGLEIGMTPMAAMQSIAVVNGFPTIWGDGALGLVRGSGVMEWIKEWAEGEGNAYTAYCSVKRKGEPEAITRSFSWDEAKMAGLLSKKGPWENYRPRMFQMRARSYALRDGFADILRGLRIREEVEDYQHLGPDNARDITPAPSVIQRLRQGATQPAADEREGFDAAFVHSETDNVLTGEIEPDTGSQPSSEPDADAPSPAQSAGADEPPTSSAPTFDHDTNILIRYARDILPMAAQPGISLDALKVIDKEWGQQIGTMTDAGVEKARQINKSSRAIFNDPEKLEGVIEHYAEMFDCSVEDLRG